MNKKLVIGLLGLPWAIAAFVASLWLLIKGGNSAVTVIAETQGIGGSAW